MPNRETYRKKAVQCMRAAGQARDPAERAALLGVASNYLALVDYVVRRNERGTAHRGGRDQDMQMDS